MSVLLSRTKASPALECSAAGRFPGVCAGKVESKKNMEASNPQCQNMDLATKSKCLRKVLGTGRN